jgi:hypothetical protein
MSVDPRSTSGNNFFFLFSFETNLFLFEKQLNIFMKEEIKNGVNQKKRKVQIMLLVKILIRGYLVKDIRT